MDDLTILVCSLEDDPIPGSLRHAWMAEMFPACRVLHLDDDTVPQEPANHPDFWAIWRAIVKRYHPEPIDCVFASESYGHRLAAEVGAAFVPVDPGREVVPISATLIREHPFRHWNDIPAVVRPYFLKRVCVFGPESTGKSTLTRRLAEVYGTSYVAEYGRIHTDAFGAGVGPDDLLRIVRGHAASATAAARIANRILISDTDPYLTLVWSDMLLGRRHAELVAAVETGPPADLYLLAAVDVPWVDDGTRYFKDEEVRQTFFRRCEEELRARRLPYAILRGSWSERHRTATSAIDDLLGEGADFERG